MKMQTCVFKSSETRNKTHDRIMEITDKQFYGIICKYLPT